MPGQHHLPGQGSGATASLAEQARTASSFSYCSACLSRTASGRSSSDLLPETVPRGSPGTLRARPLLRIRPLSRAFHQSGWAGGQPTAPSSRTKHGQDRHRVVPRRETLPPALAVEAQPVDQHGAGDRVRCDRHQSPQNASAGRVVGNSVPWPRLFAYPSGS